MTFLSGYSLILNRQNFEWNKTNFSQQFKASRNATEFISLWQKLTTMDSNGRKALPKEMLPNSSSAAVCSTSSSSAGGKRSISTSNDTSDSQPPTPKRAASTGTTHSAGNQKQKQPHPNPIDNVILQKRIGKLSSYHNAFTCIHVSMQYTYVCTLMLRLLSIVHHDHACALSCRNVSVTSYKSYTTSK